MYKFLGNRFLRNFSKLKANNFFKVELTNNPEFLSAFPHLKHSLKEIKIVNTSKTEEYDYLDSLSYHKKIEEPKESEDLDIKRNRRLVEGYLTPEGPLQWMSEEDKLKVHSLVDAKLTELEATNLSREEILFDDGRKGLPLTVDPFFQLIKRSRIAREILIQPGETFSVHKLVDLALKQDIGIDPNVGNITANQYIDETLEKLKRTRNLKSVGRQENPEMERSKEYFAGDTYPIPEKLKEILNRNVDYHYKPMTKGQFRKRNKKQVNWLDIHWRNTELLTQFMNNASKIRGRYQTRLATNQQRKIAKTIRQARNLYLLPDTSFLKPSDKKSLRTLQEDIEDYCRQAINIETGHIYLKASPQEPKMKPKIDEFINSIGKDFDEERFENVKDLELGYLPFMPSSKEQKILEASIYARKLKENELITKGVDVDELKQLKRDQNILKNPILSKLNEDKTENENKDLENKKKSFEEFQNELNILTPLEMVEAFLAEKSCDSKIIEQITNKLKKFNEEKTTSSISEQLKYLANLKRDLGLKIKVNDYEKDVIDSALKSFADAYKETEILQDFLNQN